MTLAYDSEELTVRRQVTTFSVRGRVGRVIQNYVPPVSTVALVGSGIVGTSTVGP